MLHADEANQCTGSRPVLCLPTQSVLQDIIGKLACHLAVLVFSTIHQQLSALVCPVLTWLSLDLWLAHSGLLRACVQLHLGQCSEATPGFSVPELIASAAICFDTGIFAS